MGKKPAALKETEELWKSLLFQQFHDIAAGAGIHRVHEEAVRALRDITQQAGKITGQIIGQSAGTVYNPHGWSRIYRGYCVPPQGCLRIPDKSDWRTHAQGFADGLLTRLQIQSLDREYLTDYGNRLRMYKDVNTCYDAWEIGQMYESVPVELIPLHAELCPEDEDGAALLVTGTVHNSLWKQKIFLRNEAKRLEFITEVDWRERHKLLKVEFPVAVMTKEVAHEIQFGVIHRPTHRSRQHDRDQYEVCCHRYSAVYDGSAGAAVLNDGKYGVSVSGSRICLSLLRAPMMPDMQADRGRHVFTYAIYPFAGPFQRSETVWQAVELNEPLLTGGCEMEDAQPVLLPAAENIFVDTIKPADIVPGAILVRMYEALGMQTDTRFRLHSAVKRAEQTNMLEENPTPVSDILHFHPFEIKTISLYL